VGHPKSYDMNTGFKNYLSSIRILLRLFVLGFLIFLISRLIFLAVYGSFSSMEGCWLDLIYAFVMGFRFDAKVLTIALLPLFILSALQLFNRRKSIIDGLYYKVSLMYGLFILLLYTFVAIIDFNFFKFFNTRISVLFFGIVEDDTRAVLKSVWTDYPVVLISLAFIAYAVLLFLLLKRFFRTEVKWVYLRSVGLKVVFVVFVFGIYFLGLWGSVSMAPLDVRSSTISNNSFINTLTMNGVIALRTAYSDKKESEISTDIPKMLKRYGFNSPEEAIACYLGTASIDSTNLAKNLLSTTPQDSMLDSNPPNVVFVLMESMNGYYFDLSTRERNLLGKLEDQLPDCYVFRNFLSATNGTIHSLEGLLAGTPITPLSQSVYQNCALSSSVAKPFREHGYSTSFITGGDMGWRSLDKFVYHQYFDMVEGKSSLKKFYPNAATCQWGVHDEVTFDRIFQILSNAAGKPQFIVGLTISNHTPFETPETYMQYPLTITDEFQSGVKATPEITSKSLLAYQYASNCLGQFIENVRKSPLGENTIIVATGDHTNHQLFEFTDKELLKKYGVPLILYVPQKYRPSNEVKTQRFASHKDIFPTIFNLALSNTTYLNTGFNLLSGSDDKNFSIYNYKLAMSSAGCVDFPLYFKWENDSTKQLLPVNGIQSPALDSLYTKARAFTASMDFYIMSELKSKKGVE